MPPGGCLAARPRPLDPAGRAVWCRRMLFALRSAVPLRTVLGVGVTPPNSLCLASAIRQLGAAAAWSPRGWPSRRSIVRRRYISLTAHGRSIQGGPRLRPGSGSDGRRELAPRACGAGLGGEARFEWVPSRAGVSGLPLATRRLGTTGPARQWRRPAPAWRSGASARAGLGRRRRRSSTIPRSCWLVRARAPVTQRPVGVERLPLSAA